MKQLNDLIAKVLKHGTERETRNAITKSLFGEMLEFDLSCGFPAVTCKQLFMTPVAGELAWFLRGDSDVKKLAELTFGDENRRTIWHANVEAWTSVHKADANDAGTIYGVQWRYWDNYGQDIDQLGRAVDLIVLEPSSRRMVVTAWNPSELDAQCLPPCHYFYQFYVRDDKLDILVQMRSVDLLLGAPFDIASYALLLIIVATQTKFKPGIIKMCLGDAHIYENAYEGCEELISRKPLTKPGWSVSPEVTVDNFMPSMFSLTDYKHHPSIKVEMIA